MTILKTADELGDFLKEINTQDEERLAVLTHDKVTTIYPPEKVNVLINDLATLHLQSTFGYVTFPISIDYATQYTITQN